MVMDRYNGASVRGYFTKVFELGDIYYFTLRNVANIREPVENSPAGVVDESPNSAESISKVRDLINNLEIHLMSFEKHVPQDISSQSDIADLLSNVRCYIDSERRE
ncbi:MAG: hypothetical protein AABX96_00445 [Nanoarchaeota archaeon]